MTGSSKASQFWDADAPFASASLVEMQKSPGLEGPLNECGQLWASRAAQALDARITNHVVDRSVNPALVEIVLVWESRYFYR